MAQFAIVFDNDLTQAELQEALEADCVFGTLADKFGAYPYLVTLAPRRLATSAPAENA